MEKLNIYYQKTESKRDQNVGVNIPEESNEGEIKEIILTIEGCLKAKFPNTQILLKKSALRVM